MTNAFDPRGTDPRKLIETLLSNPVAGGAAGGLAGSILGSLLMGKGGGKKLVKAGGLALVGAVAWKAWQQYQQAQRGAGAPPPGARSGAAAPALPAPFDLESDAALSAGTPLRVVQAMIAAAKADGVVDSAERGRIAQRMDEAGLGAAERQAVEGLLDRPLDLEAVVRDVDSAELAAELYAASALAVHPASRAERSYLDLLAARLGVEQGLAREIDRGVETALQA
jgi:uncharacterized membrane protein YebE (DUF533 family)